MIPYNADASLLQLMVRFHLSFQIFTFHFVNSLIVFIYYFSFFSG